MNFSYGGKMVPVFGALENAEQQCLFANALYTSL